MRPDLWSRLPMHVIEFVLRKLPFKSFVELRLVSKGWNSFILSCAGGKSPSRSFRTNMLLSVPAGGTSLTSYKEGKAWQDVSLSFLGVDPSQFKLVASDGGLLCFQNEDESGMFIICNPVTKRWKQLPILVSSHEMSAGFIDWTIAGLLTEKNGNSYKLIVVGCLKIESSSMERIASKETQTYHSMTNSWRKNNGPIISELWTWMRVPRGKVPSYCDNCLYTMALQTDHLVGNKWILQKYDVEKNVWSQIAAPAGISYPEIFKHDDRVYLAAQCCEEILGPELYIWKLDEDQKLWSQGKSIFRDLSAVFTRMPDYSDGYTPCVSVCIGRGTTLFVLGLDSCAGVTVWTYDIATEKWGCLPRIESQKFVPQLSCMFQPSLSLV